MDLAALKSKRAKIKTAFDGEEISIEFSPHLLTPEYQARLRKLASNAEEAGEENSDVLFLSEIMSGWDVVNNGEPFPPTKENLRSVPAALLRVVAQGSV